MKLLGIILLVVLGLYFAPAILAAAFGIIVSFGALLVVGGLAAFITFVVAGSLFAAIVAGGLAILVLTVGSWLPILLLVLFAVWLLKRTQTA
ncbi:hypothetical protein [Aliidiomarina celeris]|uniref:hypothetical protein n=1 Tax=Aliidiomarina celeris TaxID=2249428 RepID=UPI000DE97F83|nr:hypothetical protein [Aliidiomarina celeris]